jgi:hypothetical protein
MNLLDLMEGADPTPTPSTVWEPLTRANGCIRRETWVQLRSNPDRVGFVLIDVVNATGRVCVCWKPGDSTWHHVSELQLAAAPVEHRHEWYPSEHVWPGEDHVRLVWKCRSCPELRGRA